MQNIECSLIKYGPRSHENVGLIEVTNGRLLTSKFRTKIASLHCVTNCIPPSISHLRLRFIFFPYYVFTNISVQSSWSISKDAYIDWQYHYSIWECHEPINIEYILKSSIKLAHFILELYSRTYVRVHLENVFTLICFVILFMKYVLFWLISYFLKTTDSLVVGRTRNTYYLFLGEEFKSNQM